MTSRGALHGFSYCLALLGSTHSLDFFLKPPLQVWEHSDHSVQGVKTGQGFVLHLSISCSSSKQGLSEALGAQTPRRCSPQSLWRCLSDPPQVTGQVLHSDQGPISGHLSSKLSLQDSSFSARPGHWKSGTFSPLGRAQFLSWRLLPPPHDTEQAVQELQSVQEGQGFSLHFLE